MMKGGLIVLTSLDCSYLLKHRFHI